MELNHFGGSGRSSPLVSRLLLRFQGDLTNEVSWVPVVVAKELPNSY